MNVNSIQARVERVEPLTDSIMRLVLRPDEYISYEAGQYLKISVQDQELSFSIANAPLGSKLYELHIRLNHNHSANQGLFEQIKQQGVVKLSLPFGTCDISHLDPRRPILFIAGGTGYAPVNAIIEQLLANEDSRSFELFWGARSPSDLYLNEKVISWQNHITRFAYVSFVYTPGKKTLASLVLEKHKHNLDSWQIVISGPFDMVYSTRDVLVNQGIDASYIFSDAFSFESK